MGITLVRVMRTLGRTWGAPAAFMLAPLCSSTAVLTNLGRPFASSPLASPDGRIRVGHVTLLALETLPPLRKRTRVAFSVNSYGGPMRITMRYDTTIYSRADARAILGRFRLRLRRVATAAEPSAASLVGTRSVAPFSRA